MTESCPNCGKVAEYNGYRQTKRGTKPRYICRKCHITFYSEAEVLKIIGRKIMRERQQEELAARIEREFGITRGLLVVKET